MHLEHVGRTASHLQHLQHEIRSCSHVKVWSLQELQLRCFKVSK